MKRVPQIAVRLALALALLLGPLGLTPARSAPADLTPGRLDSGFNPGTGATNWVLVMIQQPDGKVLIGGGFTFIDGIPRHRIARLNADGSLDTSFDPGAGANHWVRAMVLQPDGRLLIGGDFTTFDGTTRNRVARLNADGSLDTSFDPGAGADGRVNAFALQPDGKVLIGGWFTNAGGVAHNNLARLNADGSLDTSFDPGSGATNQVTALALQPDGKVIIGGGFLKVNGVARRFVARLNADGSLDTAFNPGSGANNWLWALALQPNGKVLIGGDFTQYDGVARNYIARLNADGSLDTTFNPGTGANERLRAIALQPDGRVLIGGLFTSIDGTARNRVARLNADGSLDASFDPGAGAANTVFATSLQANGQVLIGGAFTTFDGVGRNFFGRLNADGSLDAGFDPGTGPNNPVTTMALQPDGRLLIGGSFSSYQGVSRNRIARLRADGSLDASFDPGAGVAGPSVTIVVLQPDGKALIGGVFNKVGMSTRNNIARLNADGSVDNTFDPGVGPNGTVLAIGLQPDGKVLIGGEFTTVGGQVRNYVARLNANGSLDTTFNPGAGVDNWVRTLALQPNGRVLIGGDFGNVAGVGRNRIARLRADGSLDTSFDPGSGPNLPVFVITLQPDGKPLIGGNFTVVGGTARNRVARLNPNGALDTTFDPGGGANGWLSDIELQPDGRVLISGVFTTIDGTSRRYIARLNADGSLDTTFDPGGGAGNLVWALARQPDGKVLIGGNFTTFDSQPRIRLARLNGATPPVFPSPALQPAVFKTPYSYAFSASGNPDPQFYRASGQLPPGLTLDSNGVLSGSPTATGVYAFTVVAHNYSVPSVSQHVTLVIDHATFLPVIHH